MLDLTGNYEIAGFLMARGMGLVYLLAFVIFYRQYSSLVSEKGIAPVNEGSPEGMWEYFSIFYFFPGERAMNFSALTGIFLSLMVLTGATDILGQAFSTAVFFLLWALIVSFINSGGVFTQPGWETILADSGFAAIFLAVSSVKTPDLVIWLFRWVLFRMMFGSAIVKLRGGEEWKNLDALKDHFESQPFPNPLSWNLHHLPERFLEFSALMIQVLLLTVPFLYFLPQPYAAYAGLFTIIFQLAIFISGNFAWLNLITITLSFSTFSDRAFQNFLNITANSSVAYPYPDILAISAFFVAVLSFKPVLNYFSRNPAQNSSYNPFNIANSYGAFPRVMEKHLELAIEGRKDGEWREYRVHSSFREPGKRPAQIAPYHHMLEYMASFYIHGSIEDEEWLENLLEKLKENDPQALKLVKDTPFEGKPGKIRAAKYRYRFTTESEREETGQYWKRERLETFMEK